MQIQAGFSSISYGLRALSKGHNYGNWSTTTKVIKLLIIMHTLTWLDFYENELRMGNALSSVKVRLFQIRFEKYIFDPIRSAKMC